MAKKPNLVLFITDQERATQHFGGLNHEDDLNWERKNLPNLTWLKQEGVSFRNAYCNSTMCTPSRCTLFTGLYSAQHMTKDTLTDDGTFSPTETQLDPTIVNMAHLFIKQGYQVHFRGKWHLSKNGQDGTTYVRSDDVAQYGFAGWQPPDSGQDQKITNFGGGYINHDLDYMRQVLAFLETVDTSEKPFFLVCSLVNPHDVLSYPNTWQYGYTPKDLDGDVELSYTETASEDLAKNYKPRVQVMSNAGMPARLGALPTNQDKENYLNFYANLIKKQDEYLGEILNTLRSKKLMEETAIIRTADHGEMAMAHGGLRQKAYMSYEEALKVPLVFVFPKQKVKGVEVQQLAGLVDIMPTIADWLGEKDMLEKLPGHSLLNIIKNPNGKETGQAYHLFTFDDIRTGNPNAVPINGVANRLRTVRDARWKYSYYFHAEDKAYPEYELYDLQEDSIEYYNLANEEVVKTLIQSGKRPADYAKLVQKTLQDMAALLQKAEKERLWAYSPYKTTDYFNNKSKMPQS